MGDENITREEIKLQIELGNEKVKGEVMGSIIKNTNDIEHNENGISRIEADIKSIRDILRNKDKLLIITLIASVSTAITLITTLIIALIK